MQVVKRNGSKEQFKPSKVRNWIAWSVQNMVDRIDMEHHILKETLRRLPPVVTTEEIHQTIIKVCLDKESIPYSEVAANLERASIYKNLEHAGFLKPQTSEFMELLDFFYDKGVWAGSWIEEIDPEDEDSLNELYIELEAIPSAFSTIKQWQDKYSRKKLNGFPVETPAMGAIALSVAMHGVTQLAFDVARDIIHCKLNLPTPVLNGMRNGNSDTISCCVINGGDTIESIDIAEFLSSGYTSKKAGIGIMLNTRSKGDDVKNGAVTHLGKAPLYRAIEASVKKYTQESRGGSANMNFQAVDPDVLDILMWKTQRIDTARRIDKIDYTFVYNDYFVECVLKDEAWHLFSRVDAPEVLDNFHSENYEDFVRKALAVGKKSKKTRALDVLISFIKSRGETGRIYCVNATRANEHSPFLDTIYQTNLCAEIFLPTKPFLKLEELFNINPQGEVAFCAIAALNVSRISVEEYPAVSERALRTVDRMIELAPGLYPQLKITMDARRSVGIGITGLAGKLYEMGLDYDGSYESLVATEELAALHYWCLLSASQKMAAEVGRCVEGVDLEWLPIDTCKQVTNPDDWSIELDWESLRGVSRLHSVLVAHMPTESSAQVSNATNGLYPSREKVVLKKARTGKVQFISEFFTDDKVRCWDVEHMHLYYGAAQNYSDQGISCDYYLDYTKYPNMKVPVTVFITWFIEQWAAGNKSAYYHVFKDTKLEESDCVSCKL